MFHGLRFYIIFVEQMQYVLPQHIMFSKMKISNVKTPILFRVPLWSQLMVLQFFHDIPLFQKKKKISSNHIKLLNIF